MNTPSLCARSAAASSVAGTSAIGDAVRVLREGVRGDLGSLRLAVTGQVVQSTTCLFRDDNAADRAGDYAGPARIPPSPVPAATHPSAAGAAPRVRRTSARA